LLRVERAETLGEPAVDRSEEITGSGVAASVAPETRCVRVGCSAAIPCGGCPSTSAIPFCGRGEQGIFVAVQKKEYHNLNLHCRVILVLPAVGKRWVTQVLLCPSRVM